MANGHSLVDTVVSAIVVIALTALAYALGWLREYYYYQVFGLPLASLDIPFQHYLFESWFVSENLLFLLLMWWTVLRVAGRTGSSLKFKVALLIIAALYSAMPLLLHYAYQYRSLWWLADHKHLLLKGLPFLMILILWPLGRLGLKDPDVLSWPYSKFAFAVGAVLLVAFAISMAKHVGSADANRDLKSPEASFARVKLSTPANSPLRDLENRKRLYLLYANSTNLFLLDYETFEFDPKRHMDIRVIVVPRDKIERIDTSYPFNTQPGALYL